MRSTKAPPPSAVAAFTFDNCDRKTAELDSRTDRLWLVVMVEEEEEDSSEGLLALPEKVVPWATLPRLQVLNKAKRVL